MSHTRPPPPPKLFFLAPKRRKQCEYGEALAAQCEEIISAYSSQGWDILYPDGSPEMHRETIHCTTANSGGQPQETPRNGTPSLGAGMQSPQVPTIPHHSALDPLDTGVGTGAPRVPLTHTRFVTAGGQPSPNTDSVHPRSPPPGSLGASVQPAQHPPSEDLG